MRRSAKHPMRVSVMAVLLLGVCPHAAADDVAAESNTLAIETLAPTGRSESPAAAFVRSGDVRYRLASSWDLPGGSSGWQLSWETPGSTPTGSPEIDAFASYFDDVVSDRQHRPETYELMKQHVLWGDPGTNRLATGWRGRLIVGDVLVDVGDEVVGLRGFDTGAASAKPSGADTSWIEKLRSASYVSAGVRADRHDDAFGWIGAGSVLGTTSAVSTVNHTLIGPQLGVGAVAETDRWRFDAAVLAVVGYQRSKSEIRGSFGAGVIPGAINRAVESGSTETDISEDAEGVGALAEFRLGVAYRLASRLRASVDWRGTAVGPVYDAADSLAYTAPYFSFTANRTKEVAFFGNLFLGLTYTH